MLNRPVWAEINLSAIAHNVQQIKSLLKPETRFCAVVKADAYGHGAIEVAKIALASGADRLAVAILNEALELRLAGISVPILVLGYTPPEQAQDAVANDIVLTVFSQEVAMVISHAAVSLGRMAKVHIKIDTGMSRIGIRPDCAGEFAASVAAMPGIEVEGVFTHFAKADSGDKAYTYEQLSRFNKAVEGMRENGVQPLIHHVANSAATLDMPDLHLDMVRPGISLYGCWPSDEVVRHIQLKPAMFLKAKVGYVKEVPPSTPISYGCTYLTRGNCRVATLPLGYADGWTRALSGRASVLVRGQRAPIVGRICMDQCMIDVTHIPGVVPGDEVLLFGGNEIPVGEIANYLGTIDHEVLCGIGKRVPRSYINN